MLANLTSLKLLLTIWFLEQNNLLNVVTNKSHGISMHLSSGQNSSVKLEIEIMFRATVNWQVCPVSCCPVWPLSLFFFPPVKYMREATPYIKRGSPVSQISWDTPPPESPRPGSPPPITLSPSPSSSSSSNPPSPSVTPCLPLQGDWRRIPLKMCCVTRAMTTLDPDNRWVALVSVDCKNQVRWPGNDDIHTVFTHKEKFRLKHPPYSLLRPVLL